MMSYEKAYSLAQAGGMNETESHEFALDQSTRKPAPALAPVFKVWSASHAWYGRYGAFETTEAIVVAETEGRAHAWAVMTYPNTDPTDWTIKEIPTDKDGITHISSQSN